MTELIESMPFVWAEIIAVVHLAVGLYASAHVVLHKLDTRAAIGWVGIIWLTPLLGSLLYLCFGVNRIRARAQSLRSSDSLPEAFCEIASAAENPVSSYLGPDARHLDSLARVVSEVTERALLTGNRISPLLNGDQAFPEMLAAIDAARRSITLSSYIFDNDQAGQTFRAALARAVARGVEVRVLIDDVGSRYTWPPILRSLRKDGVRAASFLPSLAPWKFRYSNLRSHRKIMVVDGQLGFTGGMNIRVGNLLAQHPKAPVQDIHFRVAGPVVAHLQEAFAIDWAFCTQERLTGDAWFPALAEAGSTLARGISDGPDQDFDKLRTVLLGAVSSAQRELLIVTPYFLPDEALLTALKVAALRGVDVNLVLPSVNNLRMVQWASNTLYGQLLGAGCRIWLTPPPFDHSKLMLVDRSWFLLGSANWDPRSLALNFEFNVECYDRHLAGAMADLVVQKIGHSQAVNAAEVAGRALALRLRDGVARLATPYL